MAAIDSRARNAILASFIRDEMREGGKRRYTCCSFVSGECDTVSSLVLSRGILCASTRLTQRADIQRRGMGFYLNKCYSKVAVV